MQFSSDGRCVGAAENVISLLPVVMVGCSLGQWMFHLTVTSQCVLLAVRSHSSYTGYTVRWSHPVHTDGKSHPRLRSPLAHSIFQKVDAPPVLWLPPLSTDVPKVLITKKESSAAPHSMHLTQSPHSTSFSFLI